MDEKWACGSCHSVNESEAKTCYSCGSSPEGGQRLAASSAPVHPEFAITAPDVPEPEAAVPNPVSVRAKLPRIPIRIIAALVAVTMLSGTAFVLAARGPSNDGSPVATIPAITASGSPAVPSAGPQEVELSLRGAISARSTRIAGDLSDWYCLPTKARFLVRVPKTFAIVNARFSHPLGRWTVRVVVDRYRSRSHDHPSRVAWHWEGWTGSVRPTPTMLFFDNLLLRSRTTDRTLRLGGWVTCTGFHETAGS
jgi:hypothetical protein